MKRFEEARRWFAHALRDLKAARDSAKNSNYEWSCFQSHHAAEKPLKALLYAYGRSTWCHSLTELLDYLNDIMEIGEEFYTIARELDRHYIPSRYPNAFESGYPSMYYDSSTAERAVRGAEVIIEWVRRHLKGLGLEL